MSGPRRLLPLACLCALLALAPVALANDYYLNVLILCCLNALTVLGLNLLMGYAGQVSIGHAAFVGLSAYATAFLTVTWHWPIWAGVCGGVVLSGLVAWVIGMPTLKLKGNSLAMATLGFGIIVSIAFNEAVDLTGGPSGFTGIERLRLFGYTFTSDTSYYALCALVLVLGVAVSQNLMESRTGRALRALHVSESAAQSVGVDIARHKLFVFVLSALYAGVSGALYAHCLGFIAPSSFGFNVSVQLLTMVVLGGMASTTGAVAGGFFLTSLPEFLRMFEEVDILVYGALLIACVMFLPGGLAGAGRGIVARLRSARLKAVQAKAAGRD